MSHTPGPWRWYLTDRSIDLRTPDRGQLLVMDYYTKQLRFAKRTDSMGGLMHAAHSMIEERHKRPGFVEINNPDARLIAAAPDLLAACDALYEFVSSDRVSVPDSDYHRVTAAAAAIAKARGTA